MQEEQQAVRLDKWLWAARFYKTRSLATKAVAGGKVTLNGNRTKPSKNVHVTDVLHVKKCSIEQRIEILALSGKRGSAKIASTLYLEFADSIEKRELERAERSLFYASHPSLAKRPGKKDRRKIKEFIRKTDYFEED